MNREDLELLENVMGALASVGDAASLMRLRLDQPHLERQRRYLVEELQELMAAHEEARRNLVMLRTNPKRRRRPGAPDGVEQLSLFPTGIPRDGALDVF